MQTVTVTVDAAERSRRLNKKLHVLLAGKEAGKFGRGLDLVEANPDDPATYKRFRAILLAAQKLHLQRRTAGHRDAEGLMNFTSCTLDELVQIAEEEGFIRPARWADIDGHIRRRGLTAGDFPRQKSNHALDILLRQIHARALYLDGISTAGFWSESLHSDLRAAGVYDCRAAVSIAISAGVLHRP